MLTDADLAGLHHEINELYAVLTAFKSFMPTITPFVLRRRDTLITQLVEDNDDILRGRIQELQTFLDTPEAIEKAIAYRTAEIQRADDDTTRSTGLDAIRGDFLQ